MLIIDEAKVGVIGLGYVGLPLAVEFGKVMPTVGFDINKGRINELRSGKDSTLEVDAVELAEAVQLSYSHELDDLKACNVFIVT
ncbi:MAG: Vi polysaccharide biosynthesis UDP-N-acetylglucosamine C-6 dehydrogenase TviB, partial [Thiogranum sp.]